MKKEKLIRTALRYAGQPEQPDSELCARMDRLWELACRAACFRIEFRIVPVQCDPEAHRVILADRKKPLELCGTLAWSMLEPCTEAVILGATLGIGFDRELHRLEQLNIADALLFDAIGSAMIEEELDAWQSGFSETQKRYLTDRFSCGYGDLPLSLQSGLADCLDLAAKTGIFVQSSQMMIPSKSVTALIGLADTPQPAKIRGCSSCSLSAACPYTAAARRRTGGTGMCWDVCCRRKR